MKKKRKVTKRFIVFIVAILIIVISLIIRKIKTIETASKEEKIENQKIQESIIKKEEKKEIKKVEDWRIRLANSDNILPEDFEIELAQIDKSRQFDARAIKYLNNMMNDMRKDGITNIWVQSAYRSIKKQSKLYNDSIEKYILQGKKKEEAEELTLKYINKPGASDHNLGLAVDFNNVDEEFEKKQGYKWLQENAEKYGFILRYPKDKEEITGIKYEPWHWRYVGAEYAKEMNKLKMCLEEYVEYINKQN